jgi:hypothetical protein
MSGLPPLRTVPVAASSAHSAPSPGPAGAQQIEGRRSAPALRATATVTLPEQLPLPSGEHGVPTNTAPPALTAGTERGTPLGYESGPNELCQATDGTG